MLNKAKTEIRIGKIYILNDLSCFYLTNSKGDEIAKCSHLAGGSIFFVLENYTSIKLLLIKAVKVITDDGVIGLIFTPEEKCIPLDFTSEQ